MRTHVFVLLLLGRVLFFGPAVHAQSPSSLAGTWALDPAGRGGRGNFAGYSTATRMIVTESAAEVTIQTNTGIENQMQTAVYKLDGSENAVPGPLGWDTKATAARQDGKLVVTVKRSIQGPDGPVNFEIRDVYTVVGNVLTLERSQGNRTQKTIYNRGEPLK
jgi:hypothetical protein